MKFQSTPAPRPAGTGAGGVSNPAFRPEPAVRPGSNVGIGKPASGSGAASRRPGSDEFSDHPDDRDFKQQQRKRTYIILAVMGFFILAFLVISIVMIVLYANEKNKPGESHLLI